tara:strand:- start:2400 stop:3437 length:1038 start_codon:yes stop_codon:yes gene_type:complete
MAIEPHLRFKGITQIGRESISTNLLYGIIDFFQWSLLQIGGFQNINSPTTGVSGGNRHQLYPVKDPNYTDGQIWGGFRADWVWETGVPVDYIDQAPIRVSGVFVDGAFNTVTPYKDDGVHSGSLASAAGYVDYPGGRVVLDDAISTTSTVTCDFSHRFASFIPADTPWYRELQFNSYNVESSDFGDFGTGNWSQLSQTRRHLPVVAVEIVPRRTFKGFQLGGGQWIYQDVLFHIITENSIDRNQLVDLISLQNDKSIWIPNYGLIQESPKFPLNLDFRGSPRPSAVMYPDLVAVTDDQALPKPKGGFRNKKVFMTDTIVQEMGEVNPNLFGAIVRTTFQIVEGAN